MGVPGRPGDTGVVEQQMWLQGASDDEQKHPASTDSFLRDVTVLSHQDQAMSGGQAAEGLQQQQVSGQSPAAAASEGQTTARWLLLHR
jgi:hypothetical protein